MARSPGGKSVGRVSIRVIPDTSRFREDLKKSLDRIEASTQLHIKPTIREKDHAAFLKKVRDMVNTASENKVNIPVAANTAAASASLRRVSRPRIVPLHVRVSKASVAVAAAVLARLSGARVAFNWVDDIVRGIANLDKNLPKLGLMTTSITTLVSTLLSSISGLVGIGAGLTAIMPAFLVLPGLFAGLVATIGILVVALGTAKEELKSLSPAMRELTSIIRENFWQGARKPIIDLITNLLPQLRNAFRDSSKAIGGFIGDLADSFDREFANGRFESIFSGIPESFKILSTGTDAFAGALVSLFQVAAQYVPRLSQWFVDISIRFDNWLKATSEDGRLTQWIDDAIVAMNDLWRATTATGRLFAGIWRAAEAAGGGGLAGFADNMERIANAVSSPEFQAGLTALFRGANTAVAGLNVGLRGIGRLFHDLRYDIEYAVGTAGEIFGGLINDIANALNQNSVAKGLRDFIDGLRDGFSTFGDFLPTIADGLGQLGSFTGELARQLGPVLGETLAGLAEALGPFLDYVRINVLPTLGPALVDAIKDLTPVIKDLAEALGPLLKNLSSLAAEILPKLTDALGPIFDFAITDGWIGALTLVTDVDVWDWFFTDSEESQKKWLKKAKDGLFGWVGDLMIEAHNWDLDFTKWWESWFPGDGDWEFFFSEIGSFFETVGTAWNDFWGGIGAQIFSFFTDVQTKWVSFWGGLFNTGSEWMSTVGGAVTTFLGEFSGGWSTFLPSVAANWASFWSTASTNASNAVTNILTLAGGLKDSLLTTLGNAGTWLIDVGKQIIQGLIDGVGAMIGSLEKAMRNMADRAIEAAKDALGIASPSKKAELKLGRHIPTGVARGIEKGQSILDRALANMVTLPTVATPSFAGLEGARAGSAGDTFNANFSVAAQPGVPLADQVFGAAARLRARSRKKGK